MARTRRVVRKVESASSPYFDEQLWPVMIGLIVLGGCLMIVSAAYQPLVGEVWYRTAWPSLIGIPLIVVAAMIAMARIDSRAFRRSLQLSLVLCAIVHVGIVVQLLETHLFSGGLARHRASQAMIEKRPLKLVPEYHPTQLVPEEDRPRQDFEKPVESETPEPTREPVKIVRQPSEQEQSPVLPQPVPLPEQTKTTEPNVVNRQRPNEVAPRLAAQTSQLSKQVQPSKSRQSELVDLPAAVKEQAAKVEAKAQAAAVARQTSESMPTTRPRVEPSTRSQNSESRLTRRSEETTPAATARVEAKPQRTTAEPTTAEQTRIAAVAPAAPVKTEAPVPQAASTAAKRQELKTSTVERKVEPKPEAASAVPATAIARAAGRAESQPATTANVAKSSAVRPRSVAVPSATSTVAATAPANTANSSNARNAAAEPSKLALARAAAGITAGRRSPNLDTSVPGGSSPALVASGAARRAEATQRDPAGDALSPAAAARIVRLRASSEIPTSTVKAEQLDAATAAGARQVSEVSASSGAAVTRADANARHDAATAAKGTGEIDFGPTQIIAEPGAGRAAGGGQPEVSRQSPPAALVRRASGGAPAVAIEARAAEGDTGPASNSAGPPRTAEAAPAATAAVRSAGETRPLNLGLPPAAGFEAPAESVSAPVVAPSRLSRSTAREGAPAAVSDSQISAAEPASGEIVRRAPAMAAGGATSVENVPEVGPRSAVAQAEIDHVAAGTAQSRLSRTQGEALPVDLAAPAGPGGLGIDFTPEVGINSRQARAESANVELRSARFVRSQVGGLPAVSTAAVVPTEAFSSRAARIRGQERAGGRGSESPQTEEAIERGLAFLARYQRPEGGWSLQGFPEGASLASDTAATALALLAFQGAGYNHREFQYKDVVRGGLSHLIKGQRANGDLFVPLDDASNQSVWLYSHSLAAIAICEAYGMTQDPALEEPAQKAIDFILAGQHTERGGWRYAPGVGADTSVSGWMMMALKSGELAGLEVPPATYRKIGRWLDDAQQSASDPHLYRYNPYAPDTPEQRHGRVASKTMTAVGLLMRLYTGWQRDDTNMRRGAEFLLNQLPANGTVRDPQRDTYYWYYATQVMAHMGGEAWQAWMNRLHPLLVNSQLRQGPLGGSWDPQAPIADRWGPHAGRLYVTTMNLLSLEVQYRKLPLYEDVAR